MRRITIAVMGTLSALVALFSYHTSTSSQLAVASGGAAGSSGSTGSTGSTGSSGSTSTDSSSGSGSSDSSGSSSSSDSSSSSGSSSTSGTYTGDAANTRWGIVQVQITVSGGKITKSEAIQYPTENPRDQEINSYAVPALNAAVVQSQSGNIDAISGATVTSDGYIQSLQSAINQANL